MKPGKAIIFGVCITALASCASAPDLQSRRHEAYIQAGPRFHEEIIQTSHFDLFALIAPKEESDTLTVFIEGDGYAWASRRRPSDDPTPITQTVLSLATANTKSNTIYLARPCQFVGADSRNCDVSLWTNARYSEPVVAALNEALSLFVTRFPASQIRLIGYSGGGALAALLAARRSDITSLVTIAAPLDTDAFTSHHAVTPLSASLNPRDFVNKLAHIPQIHFIGERDEVVPQQIAHSFISALPSDICATMHTIANADHWSGWQNVHPGPGEIVVRCRTQP